MMISSNVLFKLSINKTINKQKKCKIVSAPFFKLPLTTSMIYGT